MKTHNFHATRAVDVFRGRTGGTVAGTSSILGIPMVGTLAPGQVWVLDPTGTMYIPGDPGAPNAELNIEGGQSVIKAHGSTGSTETFDPTDGNVHTATLDADCTFTLSPPTGSGAATLELYLTQDTTGSRLVTWPGSVVWPGGTAPTLSTAGGSVDRIVLETLNGGTTWYGNEVGGGGSALTIKDEGTPLATAATSLDFVGAGVVASGTGAGKTITVAGVSTAAVVAMGVVGPLLTSDSPSSPLVFADILQNEAQTDFMYADLLGV